MKILHIYPVSLYTNVYLDFISKNYSPDEHEFIMMDIGGRLQTDKKYYEIFKISEISTFVLKDAFALRKRLKKADYDKLIIHSLYLNYLTLSFYFNKKVLRKSIITLWGGSDCGKFKVEGENKKYFLQAIAYNIIRKKVFRDVHQIGATLQSDYDNVVDAYGTHAEKVECKYLIPTSIEYLTYCVNHNCHPLKIQVGHSGSQGGRQLEVLEKLLPFREEDILIYCPLAYGDDFYIEKVIAFGKENFGEKFIAMQCLMPSQEYAAFLSEMDIIMINTQIQQALGNIYSCLYAGKKVYLRYNSELWNYFNELGFKVYSIQDIKCIDFQEFTHRDDNVLKYNHEKSMIQFDHSNIKNYWDNIFQVKEL